MLNRFRANERGNVAMLFALSLVPIIGMTGLAVDYARLTNLKEVLQSSIDSAALSLAASASDDTDAELTALAQRIIDDTFKPRGEFTMPPVKIARNGGSITIDAEATQDTAFMQVLGQDDFTVKASATTTFGKRKIEFVMALDNTGSMGYNKLEQEYLPDGRKVYNNNRALDLGSKMWALKEASAEVITELTNASSKGTEIRLSLVPFDTQVKVSTGFSSANWIKFNASGVPGAVSNGAWTGCLLDRDVVDGNDVKDVPPDGTNATRAPAVSCATGLLAAVEPLTSDFDIIADRIKTMQPSGYTNVTMGAVWGTSMLTASEPFTEVKTGPNIEKNLLILTDGINTRSRHTNVSAEMNAKTLAACENAKAIGVSVYTVRLLSGDADMLRQCASVGPDGPQYYDVQDLSTLKTVLKEIANKISKVRLTR
jgi:Flp pilus assembly protein TadG